MCHHIIEKTMPSQTLQHYHIFSRKMGKRQYIIQHLKLVSKIVDLEFESEMGDRIWYNAGMANDLDFELKTTEPTGNILNDACHIIETAQHAAYKAVDSILVRRNWLLGVRFYKTYPVILDSASPKFNLLSWTHYRVLLQVNDEQARAWYEREANSVLKSKRKRRCSICSTRKRKWSEQFADGVKNF